MHAVICYSCKESSDTKSTWNHIHGSTSLWFPFGKEDCICALWRIRFIYFRSCFAVYSVTGRKLQDELFTEAFFTEKESRTLPLRKMFVRQVQYVPDVTQSPSSHSQAPQRPFFSFRAPPSLPHSDKFTLFPPTFLRVICCAAPEPNRKRGWAHQRGASRGGGLGDPRPAGRLLLRDLVRVTKTQFKVTDPTSHLL